MSPIFDVPALRFPVEADLALPGSKSHANRAIVCACFVKGTTVIRNATPCDDVLVMVENLRKMGFRIDWKDRAQGIIYIEGGLPKTKNQKPNSILFCGNAGTALRFLVSVAALVPGEWIITGDEHMKSRPIGDLVTALRSLGAEIGDTNGCPPIKVKGRMLRGSSVRLKADVSSQYLSSLLLIAPMLPGGLAIEIDGSLASEPYVDLTMQVMKDFGIEIERKMNTFVVRKGEYVSQHSPHSVAVATSLSGAPEREMSVIKENSGPLLSRTLERRLGGEDRYDIEGDWSAAGAWFALNELTRSRICCTNLRSDSMQADKKLPEMIRALRVTGDTVLDCSAVPDQVMNLAVLVAFRNGKTTITGIANLRHKECDRLAVITSELKKAGIAIEERSDGIVLGGRVKNHIIRSGVVLDPHDDHRMAMCFAILGLKLGNIAVKNPDCCAKSYPQFFDDLKSVIASSRPIVIVGMRGAGKSSLGRRLAARLKLRCMDSDRVFVERFGIIKEFIAAHGWPAFRKREEELVLELLQTGPVLSLGGGATESAKTRTLLKERAVVIWVQATKAELLKRLESGKRPSITDLPLDQEVHKLLVERAPNYKEVAHIMVPPKMGYSAQVPFAVRALRALVHSEVS